MMPDINVLAAAFRGDHSRHSTRLVDSRNRIVRRHRTLARAIRATIVNRREFLTMKLSMAISFAATLFFTTASHAAEEIKDCDACPALIVVPAGEFTMSSNTKESGHPDEKPEHVVKIAKPFVVGKFEVTFDQ